MHGQRMDADEEDNRVKNGDDPFQNDTTAAVASSAPTRAASDVTSFHRTDRTPNPPEENRAQNDQRPPIRPHNQVGQIRVPQHFGKGRIPRISL